MAKKSKIECQKKRSFLVKKYNNKRIFFKSKLVASTREAKPQEALFWQKKLQDLPRNCFPVRLRRRCIITGRPRGCFSDFGLSRHMLRQLAHEGLLPGVTKSSW